MTQNTELPLSRSARELLDTLPVQRPSADVWASIQQSRLAEEGKRSDRYRRYWQSTSLAALLLITLMSGYWIGQQRPASMSAEAMALQQSMTESRLLEQQLRALNVAPALHASHQGRHARQELARIDVQINQAYIESRPDAALTTLWQQRSQLLSNMIQQGQRRNLQPERI